MLWSLKKYLKKKKLFQTTEDQTTESGENNSNPVKAIPDQLKPVNVTCLKSPPQKYGKAQILM